MNRIILIGNGFDLAHGLKTSYNDFIDDYWERKVNTIFPKTYLAENYFFRNLGYNPYREYKDTDINTNNIRYDPLLRLNDDPEKHGYEQFISLYSQLPLYSDSEKKFRFENHFLKQITENKSLHNWIDIEAEYYRALNDCLEGKREEGIEKLNHEFLTLKTALEDYLIKVQNETQINKSPEIEENMFSPLLDEDILNLSDNALTLTNTLFLNFNYTSTEKLYTRNNNEYEVIHIHGELEHPDNPVIFGYGDEIDDTYKLIENKNDNKYLENIKSFKYFEARNYKNLLNFIDSDRYQIFIMGHSCGISDRTLLNTLFEHENCFSIKVFYHKRGDGSDNHSDMVRNISRNFTDKSLMRKIVVNKKDSVPLS
ncbi:MAG: bacteriophage abortive infection AbiH family protein [Spirochaetaceae bacterium]|jgi:hypothetical protein|nr:bacteriophage abortive infection AbiH family protein [Spirochaetaceae bacterium]